MNRRAVGKEEATQVLCGPDASPAFVGLEPANVLFTKPEFTPECDVRADSIDLCRCECDRDVATPGPVTIDHLAFANTFDLPDRVEDRSLETDACFTLRPIACHEF